MKPEKLQAGVKKEFEEIYHDKNLIAMIMRADYHQEGVQFFTPASFPLQMGYMYHPQGDSIQPHIHRKVSREVVSTQEVLFVKYGCVKVDFYSSGKVYLESRTLHSGDVLFLASEGHGFTMLEPTSMIEIKTGPYLGEEDKDRFLSIVKPK